MGEWEMGEGEMGGAILKSIFSFCRLATAVILGLRLCDRSNPCFAMAKSLLLGSVPLRGQKLGARPRILGAVLGLWRCEWHIFVLVGLELLHLRSGSKVSLIPIFGHFALGRVL